MSDKENNILGAEKGGEASPVLFWKKKKIALILKKRS